jgi:hypothetical protein
MTLAMATTTSMAMTWHTEIAGAMVTLTLTAESVARDAQVQRDQARVLLQFLTGNGAKTMNTIELKRMWIGGPLREWSPVQVRSFISLGNGGFGGRYVCDDCLKPVTGVYRVTGAQNGGYKWQCAGCKEAARLSAKPKRVAHPLA